MSIVLASVLAGSAVSAVAVLWFRRTFLVVTVRGKSMEPTYQTGEQVLVRRMRRSEVRADEVVVLRGPESARVQSPSRSAQKGSGAEPGYLIKRVLAVPGDDLPRERVPALRDVADRHVPAGMVVLLGDNSAASYDSRSHGYFSLATVVGTVVRRLPTQSRSGS
ncbi:S26 family signal peptidase [Nonomuraea sp. NPDC001831]|uniref:S26 family signal peptidase n=1 Tax=Nonomuraea sp. NPDC001831 TaxID=3364340 RepID=UPI0036C2E651